MGIFTTNTSDNDKDAQTLKSLQSTIKDTHSKECRTCGLQTDFIFSDEGCEYCTKKIGGKEE